MTLQKLTDTLQNWCHQGHAQDTVVVLVEHSIYPSACIKVEANPHCDRSVWLCVDIENDDTKAR